MFQRLRTTISEILIRLLWRNKKLWAFEKAFPAWTTTLNMTSLWIISNVCPHKALKRLSEHKLLILYINYTRKLIVPNLLLILKGVLVAVFMMLLAFENWSNWSYVITKCSTDQIIENFFFEILDFFSK